MTSAVLIALTFAHPGQLLWLVIPVFVLVFVWMRTGRETALPFDHALPVSGRWLARIISSVESIPALILGVVIVLLAGPQHLGLPRDQRALTNIEFCVDVSGSMTAPFGKGTRYEAAMTAIEDFLTYREGDAFGLTFFSDNVLKWVPLTNDSSAFSCALPFMNPSNDSLPPGMGGGTMIGKALDQCRHELLQYPVGDRMVILVSDGQSFDLETNNDLRIAKDYQRDGIVVYAVHIADSDVPDPIVNISSLTGGEVFNPGDPVALERVFARIGAMQKVKMERGTAEILDFFWPFTLTGLGLAASSLLAMFGLRYTPW